MKRFAVTVFDEALALCEAVEHIFDVRGERLPALIAARLDALRAALDAWKESS